MNSKFGDCCNCPALVDGRYFTEYRDRDALQFNIMKENNITNSNQFRDYLINNGTNLMGSTLAMLETNYKCNYNIQNSTPTLPIDTGKFLDGNIIPDLTKNIGEFPSATASPSANVMPDMSSMTVSSNGNQ